MTEKPSSPVSVRKGASPSAGSTAPTERPTTIKALVATLLLTGVCAIIAAASLFGLHSYLVKSITDSNPVPPITNSQIQSQGSQLHDFVANRLTASPGLGAAAVSADASATQNWVQRNLPKSNVEASDISDQAQKMHDFVSSSLQGVNGTTLNSGQIQQQAGKIEKTYTTNLKDLQGGQATPLTPAEIQSKANQIPTSQLIANLVLLLALGFVAAAVWRGKYWSRWAVIGLWVLSSYTGALGGLNSLFAVTANISPAFVVPAFLAGLSFVASVVLALIGPSRQYFNANRPVRPAGAPARRGLFAPRVAPPSSSTRTHAQTRPAERGTSSSDRSRAKQRASAEAVAKGAELARSRAKASKSRRTGA
ncbi:MAG TPA: hypothetical protein VFH38_09750 [Jatrophihabitans sp.]|nr:hypothetical protein [Jatrophihabitans sp.]